MAAYLDHLRHSLSTTLSHFPTLAARMATLNNQNLPSSVVYLDPENSAGVRFTYIKAEETKLSDLLTPVIVPDPLLRLLLDLNDTMNYEGHRLPLLGVQVTELVDGICMGVSINHSVADGSSMWQFMGAWNEMFGGKVSISRPPVREPVAAAIHIQI